MSARANLPDSRSLDAFSPREIAGRVEEFCIVQAQLPLLSLSMLAGAFIGLGAMMFTLVASDAGGMSTSPGGETSSRWASCCCASRAATAVRALQREESSR